jgi:hypothetical protein
VPKATVADICIYNIYIYIIYIYVSIYIHYNTSWHVFWNLGRAMREIVGRERVPYAPAGEVCMETEIHLRVRLGGMEEEESPSLRPARLCFCRVSRSFKVLYILSISENPW